MDTPLTKKWLRSPLTGMRLRYALAAVLSSIVAPLLSFGVAFAVPSAPVLTGTTANNQNTLSWSIGTAGDSFTLKRATTIIYTGTLTTFTDEGLTNGTTYTYTVTETGTGLNAGTSPASNTVTLTPPVAAPAKNSLSCASGILQVVCNWSPAGSATGYKLYRMGSQVYSGTALTFTDTGLTAGTTYGYYVTSSNTGGTSDASNSVSGTPLATPVAAGPSDPQNITPRDEQILALLLATFIGYKFISVFRWRSNV